MNVNGNNADRSSPKNERPMNKLIMTAALSALLAGPVLAQKEKMVGGAPMYPSKNIVENAMNSTDHTTLVAAVKAADLVETLQGPGPFTVFAPTNAAFDALPPGTVDNLLKPENKKQLQGVLTYHVLAGKFDSKTVAEAIKKGNGKATMKTVAGGELNFSMKGDKLLVWDANGGSATVTIADVYQSNGVIHVVDKVLLPKM
jgi:uncharacterized surface protein with fasciclin (FAS1) repeats